MKRARTSLFLAVALGFLAQSGAALADVIGLEIVGPNEVAENFSASYKAIAYYDDDSRRNVTDSALWAVEPNMAANINENGVLTTKDIVTHQSVTILAGYTEGNIAVEAEKAIDILAICPTGTALQFDGVDDYVEIPDAPSLRFTQHDSFTISYWALPISDMFGGWVLCKMQPSVQSHCFTYETKWDSSNSTFSFVISRANSTGWVLLQTIAGSAPAGGWYHVATVYDNRDMKIYLNGQLSNSGIFPYTTDSTPSNCNISIGARLVISTLEEGRFFDGTIDEVAIYNRSLSDEEIQANMYMKLAVDEPNLVAYWDFDEGQGQIVYDLSGNGNHGYLGGDPCAVEESDPLWVESDAPIGICSLYQIATLATDGAIGRKTALLEELLVGLAQERTSYEALEEWLESGDYGNLNYGDIVTAKQKIHSAIQHESQQSIGELEKSIEKLKDSLSALGYEPEPPTLNQETLALSELEWREPYEIAIVRTEDAIARKVEVLEKIGAEVEKEWAAYEALEELLESGYYGDLNYGDIVTAKQKIHSAIQHEEQSIDALEKSIEKLKDALSALGYDPAGQASNPNPANGAVNVSTIADLSWTAGSKAVSHDVYFGTTSPPPFISNQTATVFDPGTMTGVTKYYWRIDEVNPSWVTTGTVWTFTTILPPPSPP